MDDLPDALVQSIISVEEFFVKAAAEKPLPTDPAPDASWMGSFILKDEKISISLQAHPTSRGLLKVKEFSKQMPQVLEFELCLYENFFRTFFKGCDPDDKDIGLYFFPNNGIRLNEYISQLEKLSGDIFLRSCIDGVELLVFTSKVLHKDYRKRNKSNFLWGMYRRRHGKGRGAVEETMVADRDNGLEDSHTRMDARIKELTDAGFAYDINEVFGEVNAKTKKQRVIGLGSAASSFCIAGDSPSGESSGQSSRQVNEEIQQLKENLNAKDEQIRRLKEDQESMKEAFNEKLAEVFRRLDRSDDF